MNRQLCWLACLMMALLPALGRADDAAPYRVLASIRPLALLAQELTAGLPVQVDTLLPAAATTHDFALSPSDLVRIRQARQVLWVGPASEPYLRKSLEAHPHALAWESLPDLLRLPARPALHRHQAQGHDHAHNDNHGHKHGHSHQHDGSGVDPHIWWSVPNAIVLARALEQRLVAANPAWREPLAQQRARLEQTLLAQLVEQRARLASGFKPFLLAHDAFHYLEEDLGIQSDAAIMLDPEIRPGMRHLLALKKRVQDQGIGCVLTGVLVPTALIDKIDTQPPLLRQPLDELGWDYSGSRYSEWLAQSYEKMAECVGLSLN